MLKYRHDCDENKYLLWNKHKYRLSQVDNIVKCYPIFIIEK